MSGVLSGGQVREVGEGAVAQVDLLGIDDEQAGAVEMLEGEGNTEQTVYCC